MQIFEYSFLSKFVEILGVILFLVWTRAVVFTSTIKVIKTDKQKLDILISKPCLTIRLISSCLAFLVFWGLINSFQTPIVKTLTCKKIESNTFLLSQKTKSSCNLTYANGLGLIINTYKLENLQTAYINRRRDRCLSRNYCPENFYYEVILATKPNIFSVVLGHNPYSKNYIFSRDLNRHSLYYISDLELDKAQNNIDSIVVRINHFIRNNSDTYMIVTSGAKIGFLGLICYSVIFFSVLLVSFILIRAIPNSEFIFTREDNKVCIKYQCLFIKKINHFDLHAIKDVKIVVNEIDDNLKQIKLILNTGNTISLAHNWIAISDKKIQEILSNIKELTASIE